MKSSNSPWSWLWLRRDQRRGKGDEEEETHPSRMEKSWDNWIDLLSKIYRSIDKRESGCSKQSTQTQTTMFWSAVKALIASTRRG